MEENHVFSQVEEGEVHMINLIAQVNGKTVSDMPAEQLRSLFAGSNPIVTTDFEVSGEEGVPLETPDGHMVGYRYNRDQGKTEVLSIDHHGPDMRMQRRISSTNLALEFVKAYQTRLDVVVTHTDYDSVVAAALLTGRLSRQLGDLLGPAAIAADHTGQQNVLADTLQAIQAMRNVEFSLTCLNTLLQQGEAALPQQAREALEARRTQRVQLQSLIQAGLFQQRGTGVYAAYLNTRIDGELLPSLLPDAVVIITVSPPQKSGDGALVKVRLGMAAPEGMSLLAFHLPPSGGRWNALSTGRQGGTHDPEAFIAAVCTAVERFLF